MKIASHVRLTEIDEQLVLMDLRKNEYYVVNETGGIILLALSEGKPLEEGLERIRNEFSESKDAEKDVKEFVQNLVKVGLLEVSS